MRRLPFALGMMISVILPPFAASSAPVFSDGFEKGIGKWSGLWTRDEGAGRASVEKSFCLHCHAGRRRVKIEHTGGKDWSFEPAETFPASPGEIYEMACSIKLTGTGTGTASVVATLRDANDEVLDWAFAARTLDRPGGWRRLKSRFIVPVRAATIKPRVIGTGPATVLIDNFSFKKKGTIATMGTGGPVEATIENRLLKVTIQAPEGTFSVLDRRTSRLWTQRVFHPDVVVTSLKEDRLGLGIWVKMMHVPTGLTIKASFALEGRKPELYLDLAAKGEMPRSLNYPHPFVTAPGERLILPVNEGIAYPVDDESLGPMWYHTYGGHGLCMSFYGSAAGEEGWMAVVETPDDAAVRIARLDGNLAIAQEWQAQKGRFGYFRRLRYAFFDRGGYVAMAKRYRKHAKETDLFRTLDEKARKNAGVDLLVGAANIWNWDHSGDEAVNLVREMREAGMDRILWSRRQPAETVAAMNGIDGVLTSRYDIYQDLMDPAVLRKGAIEWTHPDWTQEAWPRHLMTDEKGEWIKGWGVDARDRTRHYCGVLCDKVAPDYARRRIAAELKTHPYRSRFIDTTTASPWRECWHQRHPLTRTESKKYKMELLRVVSEEFSLVCGSETGHDAAVPYVHYFEGMLSLGPYRARESGRNMQEILEEVPEQISKFQVGEFYRLPLWELVYHDCVVSQWYWGDYNNKLPKVWKKRDLFNILYGTPPMYMFTREGWKRNKARFVESYRSVCPPARKVGYLEMIDHRILTEDRTVQETEFAGGIVITVNFGERPFRHRDGRTIPALSCRVRE